MTGFDIDLQNYFMASSIVPLSKLPKSLVTAYFSQKGMSPEVIEWKYFDLKFNRERERGYAWLSNDRVVGFNGVIPFAVRRGGQTLDVNWSCDWALANPTLTPGIGIKLFQRAIESSGCLFVLGGNNTSRNLVSRMATRTVVDAGRTFILPLRFGALLNKVSRRFPFLRFLKGQALKMIPLLRVPRKSSQWVTVEPGVAESVASLLDLPPKSSWHPAYDFNYIDWQIGRCPKLEAWTCYIPAERGVCAASVFWRTKKSTELWRMALWSKVEAGNRLEAVLAETIRQVLNRKGVALSIVVSRLDLDLIAILRTNGFFQARTSMPLFINVSSANTIPFGRDLNELCSLSYLDTDLAYRF